MTTRASVLSKTQTRGAKSPTATTHLDVARESSVTPACPGETEQHLPSLGRNHSG